MCYLGQALTDCACLRSSGCSLHPFAELPRGCASLVGTRGHLHCRAGTPSAAGQHRSSPECCCCCSSASPFSFHLPLPFQSSITRSPVQGPITAPSISIITPSSPLSAFHDCHCPPPPLRRQSPEQHIMLQKSHFQQRKHVQKGSRNKT